MSRNAYDIDAIQMRRVIECEANHTKKRLDSSPQPPRTTRKSPSCRMCNISIPQAIALAPTIRLTKNVKTFSASLMTHLRLRHYHKKTTPDHCSDPGLLKC